MEAVIGEPVSDGVFPCFVGKYREICALEAQDGGTASSLRWKFSALRKNSLKIGTGNIA